MGRASAPEVGAPHDFLPANGRQLVPTLQSHSKTFPHYIAAGNRSRPTGGLYFLARSRVSFYQERNCLETAGQRFLYFAFSTGAIGTCTGVLSDFVMSTHTVSRLSFGPST